MIKAIIFDCFGVLTADSWHEFRVSLPADQQGEASKLNHKYCAGSIGKAEFLQSVSSLTGRPESFIASLIDNENSKNIPLLEYIGQLKQDYKIGLLSNVASDFIQEKLLTEEEQKLFDSFILSYKYGLTKPDPEMYKLAAKKLQVKPLECVFVDDIENLAKASEAIGMKAIVYKDLPQMKHELNRILASTEAHG